MKLKNIAINNLRRRKARAIFLVLSLMIGAGSIVALFSTTRILEKDVVHKMEEYGANIVITPKSEGLSLNYGGFDMGGVMFDVKEISQTDLEKIKNIKNAANIRTVSPKIFGAYEHQAGKVLIVGIDFDSEFTLKPWWKINGNKPQSDMEIIGGHDAAKRLNLKSGSETDFFEKRFKVSGIINPTGSQDDNLIFMDLKQAQQLFGKQDKVAMADVAAHCGDCPVHEIVKQISEIIPGVKVTAVQQVVQGRMDTLAALKKLSLGISVIVLLVGSMVVFVTMMASVSERTREIGIFSAIGFRRSHIMRIILMEALIVSFAAGILGYAAGIGGTRAIMPFFVENMPKFTIDPLIPVWTVMLAVVIGMAASFYPAMTASRMDPSEALRTL
ncbi:ABC transporter permease [Desulfobacterales bacterium HSG17]|nr:ABC transporter permease [Desulfobacterales bacterium HSG17]